MKEILQQRKVELELAAKNAIVDIFVIEEQEKAISTALETKKRFLKDLNASLREVDHIIGLIKPEKADEPNEPKKEAPAEEAKK